MISSSVNYKTSVLAPIRQVNARATITMSNFSQLSALAWNWTSNYVNKVAASVVENGNIHKRISTSTIVVPSGFGWEPPQSDYNNIKAVDGSVSMESSTTNGFMAQSLFSFDIVRALEDKFGKNIWQGKTLLSDKVTIAKGLVTGWTFNWNGYGVNPTGNKASVSVWSPSGSWGTIVTHSNSTVTKLSIPSSSSAFIDSNGFIHFNAYGSASNGTIGSSILTDYVELQITVNQTTTRTFDDNTILMMDVVEEVSTLNDTIPSNQLSLQLDNTTGNFNFMTLSNMHTIIASRPKIDVELGVVLPDGVSIEWIPVGTFYLDSWKNDVGGMSITFTAFDLMLLLSNISFSGGTYSTALSLAQAIFSTAGITAYNIDSTIDGISSSTVVASENCRDLLQDLAIASRCTVYQDRYGVIQIQRFATLDQSLQYTNFTTSQVSLFGYTKPNNYNTLSADGGMRSIHFDSMYQIPEVSLDKSVYQLVINVYTGTNYVSYTYTNNTIGGQNGQSFTLDIPLITSKAIADKVSDWFFNESNYNAVYVVDWRQNPVLMATDIVVVDDSTQSAKQTRVYKQEFHYEGYLSGTTESRGGI